MACLLYCVTCSDSEIARNLVGVCDQPLQSQEFSGLQVHWSEIADPETALAEGAARKSAEVKFRQVLREIIAWTTPIAFVFPAVVADAEGVGKYVVEAREQFEEALGRLGDTVQYEMTASWATYEQADWATPVSGSEYEKRRQEAAERVAAVDTKLKTVTDGCVRQWRAKQERRQHRWYALVARSERERFVAALRSAGPSEGVRLRLSGPWPPGEFVRASSEPQ